MSGEAWPLDDAILLERCARGEDLAWEALVRRHQARVYGLALHYLRSRDEALDMAQEVFVRLYQRLGDAPADHFLPWLMRLARNACIDRLRRLRARPPATDVPVGERLDLRHPGPDPEEEAAAEARRRLLYRAMDRLSDRNREMILLKEIQGLKLEEIAAMLSLPLGTVKSRSSRARVELAAMVRQLDPSYGA